MKLKFTRKTWYFFLAGCSGGVHAGRLCRAGRDGFFRAGNDRVLPYRHRSAVSGGAEGRTGQGKSATTRGVFVVLMLSKLGCQAAGRATCARRWCGRALLAIRVRAAAGPSSASCSWCASPEALRLVFWLLTKYAGMSGLAFWTNLMFMLLTCARGWAGLALYKTQEETL